MNHLLFNALLVGNKENLIFSQMKRKNNLTRIDMLLKTCLSCGKELSKSHNMFDCATSTKESITVNNLIVEVILIGEKSKVEKTRAYEIDIDTFKNLRIYTRFGNKDRTVKSYLANEYEHINITMEK